LIVPGKVGDDGGAVPVITGHGDGCGYAIKAIGAVADDMDKRQ
jgi:hypothetical protein